MFCCYNKKLSQQQQKHFSHYNSFEHLELFFHFGYFRRTYSDSLSEFSFIYSIILFCRSFKLYLSLLSVEVSLVTNCIQREQSNNLLLLHQGCQHIENGTAADEGEVGGGGLIKNGGLIKLWGGG